jgi:carbonic anhydrase
VLRSLIISHHIGGTQEFIIINNTRCGMLTFGDENVRQQIRKVKSHPWIPESILVRGFIYDVDTGRLSEVS